MLHRQRHSRLDARVTRITQRPGGSSEGFLIEERIATAGIVTRDRLPNLLACLESYLENCLRTDGRNVRLGRTSDAKVRSADPAEVFQVPSVEVFEPGGDLGQQTERVREYASSAVGPSSRR